MIKGDKLIIIGGFGKIKYSAPAYWIPSYNEWYKSAFYKSGGTNAGYWTYATQSNTAPTSVLADAFGNGLASGVGNYANFAGSADWNGSNGNVTTVGTNGGPSADGTFDQNGNVWEWNEDWFDSEYYKNSPNNDPKGGNSGDGRSLRGGSWIIKARISRLSYRGGNYPGDRYSGDGFRLVLLP
jgi:formylglycine-generating enzyme required for sulfatase activity